MQSDTKKWRHFDDLAPKSGAPVKYTGFQGRIPCLDVRMGLWAQNAYLAKDRARSGVIIGKVWRKGGFSIEHNGENVF